MLNEKLRDLIVRRLISIERSKKVLGRKNIIPDRTGLYTNQMKRDENEIKSSLLLF